jgi:hypothetical protein
VDNPPHVVDKWAKGRLTRHATGGENETIGLPCCRRGRPARFNNLTIYYLSNKNNIGHVAHFARDAPFGRCAIIPSTARMGGGSAARLT